MEHNPSCSALRLTRPVPICIGFTDEWTNGAADDQWKLLGLVQIANERQIEERRVGKECRL